MLALPAEALVFERAAFRLRPHKRWIAGAVCLAEAMAPGDQRDGLFVVHGHAEERFADVLGRCDRIGLAIRTFGVHVNQPHLNRTERLRELALAAVALVAQPRPLGTPEELLGLPDVGSTAGEAECLEAHRFQSHV